MTRAEFETELRREGYEIREGEFKPDHHSAAHAHDFDARVLVLDGSVTMVFGKDHVTYGPGDACNRAGRDHARRARRSGRRPLRLRAALQEPGSPRGLTVVDFKTGTGVAPVLMRL